MVLIALVAPLPLSFGAPSSRAVVSPTMTGFVDDEDDFIGLTFDDGTQVGAQTMPGPVIPPGTYQVSVDDVSQVSDFDLAGAGVNVATGIESRVQASWTVTFQPCALYSYRNDAQGYSVYWFQTSSSLGSTVACSGPLAGTATIATSASTTTSTPVKITGSSSLPPGAALSALGTVIYTDPLRGTLRGVVAGGSLALTFKGKPLSTLKAGRYKIAAPKLGAKTEIVFQKAKGRALEVCGAAFAGNHTVTVDLRAGNWTVSASPSRAGSPHSFIVVTS